MNQVYVTAEGFVTPCCWIGNEPTMTDYKKLHDGYLTDLSVSNRDVDEILTDPRYLKIENSWNSEQPFSACKHFCMKPLPAVREHAQGTNSARTLNLQLINAQKKQPEPKKMTYVKNSPVILPIYWNTNPKLNKSFTDGLKLFYDRIQFKDMPNEKHLFGEDIDAMLKEAADASDYNWAVVFGYGNIFASQLKIVKEITGFIQSLDEEVLVCGHLMDKKGFYCGLHEQCFVVNLEVYRRLGRPEFGPYQKTKKLLHNYVAGPSVHGDYTPQFLKPSGGKAEYQTKVNGWNFVDVSMANGLKIFNFPNSLRESKVFIYPDDELEKLNKNLELLHQLEDMENFTQRAALAHLIQRKLGVSSGPHKGSFGYKERTNCLFVFNTQLLLPDPYWVARGKGPIDQYTGPCSGFQDIALLKTYGFGPQTELIYFDINPLAMEMKEFIFEVFDGRVESFESLAAEIRQKYPTEEVYTGNFFAKIRALLKVFNDDEREFTETWDKFRQLKRSYVKANLLVHAEKVFEVLDPSKTIIFNITDIYLGQNELLYGYEGISEKFKSLHEKASNFPKLMLTGTSVNQTIFLEFANKLDLTKI